MRYLIGLTTAFFMLFSGAAFADPMGAAFGNTLNAEFPDGSSVALYADEDGTYTGTTSDGTEISGVWHLEGDNTCFERQSPSPQPAVCTISLAGRSVGDSWSVDDNQGRTLTLSLTAGR